MLHVIMHLTVLYTWALGALSLHPQSLSMPIMDLFAAFTETAILWNGWAGECR